MRKIFIFALLGLVACSARVGPKFNVNTMVPAPDNAAIVYFYRPSHFLGNRARFPVIVNENNIGTLNNSGYFKHVISPGDYDIHSDTHGIDRISTFTFEAGKTYFLKCYIEPGTWTSSIRFSAIHNDDAIPEIKKTGLQRASKTSSRQDAVNAVDSFDEGEDEYYSPQDTVDAYDDVEGEYYAPQD